MKFHPSEKGQGILEIIGVFVLLCIIFYAISSCTESVSRRKNKTVTQIVISGKVVNSQTNEWLNNRLVLMFLHNIEVARSTSYVGQSQEGTHDGLFVLAAGNPYDLNMDMLNGNSNGLVFGWDDTPGYGVANIYLDNFEEGSSLEIPIPSKNISYVIKVLDGDVNNLPSSLLTAGSAMLRDNGAIVVSLPDSLANQTPSADNNNMFVQGIKYNTSTQSIDVNKFTVPIDNCAGSVVVSQKYIQSQTFIHEYHQETTAGVSVEIPLFFVKIVPELQTRYGYENGQIETKTVEYNMAAEPQTKVTYIVTWQEVWETGTAEVTSGSDLIEIPFKVKTNLVYQIDSEPSSCQ